MYFGGEWMDDGLEILVCGNPLCTAKVFSLTAMKG